MNPHHQSITVNFVELLLSREFPGVEITPKMVIKRQQEINRARKRVCDRERRQRDPIFRLSHNLRARIYAAIKKRTKSQDHLPELIGCSILFLRSWLQSQFLPGMSWENYGPAWHIDHIKPVSSFDLSIPHQRLLCFHYSNLQPLWAHDNHVKYNKFPMAGTAEICETVGGR